jgi:hypothetical protein
MADDRLVDSFKRNATEEVRATVRTYRGRQYMDVRIYYMDDQGEFKPTKKGINLSVEMIGELSRMVDKLKEAVAEETAAQAPSASGAGPATPSAG